MTDDYTPSLEEARNALAQWSDVYDMVKPEVVGQRLANALRDVVAGTERMVEAVRAEEREKAAQPVTDEQVEAAARAVLPLFDASWGYYAYEELNGSREELHAAVRAALEAAREAGR